jgi:hypothetical protein
MFNVPFQFFFLVPAVGGRQARFLACDMRFRFMLFFFGNEMMVLEYILAAMDGLIDGCIVSGTLMLILSRIWLLTFINEIHFCFLTFFSPFDSKLCARAPVGKGLWSDDHTFIPGCF